VSVFFHYDPNQELQMKLISCVIRTERLGAVKEALFQAGVTGITISRVSGHGGEQEVVEHYRGSSLVLEFREKVKIEMACSEPFVEPTIKAILSAARTGEVGDGKIFVQPLEQVIRIRTGERDNAHQSPPMRCSGERGVSLLWLHDERCPRPAGA
jgi:nitrogen regulatory protein P-II 1